MASQTLARKGRGPAVADGLPALSQRVTLFRPIVGGLVASIIASSLTRRIQAPWSRPARVPSP